MLTVLEGAGQLTLREAKNFLIRFLVSKGYSHEYREYIYTV